RLWGARLDAGALHAPQRSAQTPARTVPGGACGIGDAPARWHESGGQGIHRRAGPSRPGRPGSVALCRRRRTAPAGPAGESLRHRRHGGHDSARAADAVAGAAGPASGTVEQYPHAGRALVAQAVSRGTCRRRARLTWRPRLSQHKETLVKAMTAQSILSVPAVHLARIRELLAGGGRKLLG